MFYGVVTNCGAVCDDGVVDDCGVVDDSYMSYGVVTGKQFVVDTMKIYLNIIN